MVKRRLNFKIAARFVEPAALVFLDESGAKTNMTCLYGRAPVGERCVDHRPHGHWTTTTMLSSIRLEGVLREATVVFDGPMNRPTFLAYVQQCLVPALRPGDVVVMDNLSAHKDPAVDQMLQKAGAALWYLPPYSPDLNPIEKLWSKVKSWLRREMGTTHAGLLDAIAAAILAVEPAGCHNYPEASGYGNK